MSRHIEIIVGLFVAVGIGALVLLSLQVSGISEGDIKDGYRVNARFINIGQLKARVPVKVGGVTVGKVEGVNIDPQTYEVVVTMVIQPDIRLPEDTGAGIYTSGLLGEQYLALSPGGEESFLQDGDEITITSDAVVLEDVISRFLYSQASGDE